MKQRVSLRIASKHTVWTTPTYGTLLTGIYAEDHMAAAKAKGDRLDEFNVYELHPYLKVVHGNYEGEQFSHKMVVKRSYYWSDWQFYGFHEVHVGDFCLIDFPDDFPLDDEYISQPPVKEIMVNMRHTHGDDMNIRRNGGAKFKDIRAEVKQYLIDYAHDGTWQECKATATSTEHTTTVPWPVRQRWIMPSGSDMVYNYEMIAFDGFCFWFAMAFVFKVCMASTIDVFDILLWVRVYALLGNYASTLKLPTRTVTVVTKRYPNEPQPCGHTLDFHSGVPITTEEKLTLEKIGVITEANDPYYTKAD